MLWSDENAVILSLSSVVKLRVGESVGLLLEDPSTAALPGDSVEESVEKNPIIAGAAVVSTASLVTAFSDVENHAITSVELDMVGSSNPGFFVTAGR